MTNIQKKSNPTRHTINYSSDKMAQKFDNQYFSSQMYKIAKPLDNNTDLVIHPHDVSAVYKTLLFRMRNVAKKNYTIKETKEQRKPRIQYCGYSLTANDSTPVNLCKGKSGSIYFNGIANCGGYWRCPVCAVKISEHKKEFLSKLIIEHQKKGLKVGFLTLTVRHKKTEPLKKSLDKLLKNYRQFQMSRFFQKSKAENGFIGQVKTLEITWSEDNGWHPHLHLLYFYNSDSYVNAQSFQMDVISRWFKFKDNNGLLKAQNQQVLNSDISDYVAKYDITSEMTKGQIKGSKGLTPFTALGKLCLGDFETFEEKRRLYALYTCYVEQTFGKHFVNVSNSIRELYKEFLEDIDKTDDEIVNESDIDEILLKISVNVWKKICKNDLQPLIINKFKENGLDGVYALLTYFKDFNDLDIITDKQDYQLLINTQDANEENMRELCTL